MKRSKTIRKTIHKIKKIYMDEIENDAMQAGEIINYNQPNWCDR